MNTNRKIVIAGGSGFIGCHLAAALARRGNDVVVLTRHPEAWAGQGRAVKWNGRSIGHWLGEIDGAYAVINLAGKNVNCRYTRANLNEIDQSRVNAVRVMGEAIRWCKSPPRVLVQASTTAIYGDTGDRECDETTPPGDGIPPATAKMWESAFDASSTPHTRRVLLRMPFVLGPDGGALRTLSALTRCFMGGAVGTGKQFISWVHIDDLVRMVLRAIDDDRMSGLYVASTPNAVRNEEFMRELRGALHRPWSPRVPATLVRLGCFLLRTEPVLALTGRRTMPRRLMEEGFAFKHPTLAEALNSIFGGENGPKAVPSIA
jgi:uncharacterized protein (TIGR01777 family)